MKTSIKAVTIAAILLAVVFPVLLSAQNLLDNEYYRKAVEQRQQAQAAMDAGDYAKAEALSAQAEENAQLALTEAQRLGMGYRASNWIERARERIAFATNVNAEKRYPNEWKTATDAFNAAQAQANSGEFQASIDSSKSVIAALKDVQPEPRVAAAQPAQPAPSGPVLPAYYVVRLIPERRDCFWRIAGYPFVYGDPTKWKVLYEANKQVLKDPDNPNLIHPGMVFKIPSINGEKREGTYKPDKE